jgi:hypothetical protein
MGSFLEDFDFGFGVKWDRNSSNDVPQFEHGVIRQMWRLDVMHFQMIG